MSFTLVYYIATYVQVALLILHPLGYNRVSFLLQIQLDNYICIHISHNCTVGMKKQVHDKLSRYNNYYYGILIIIAC